MIEADFILSLGSACRPAWHLKANNLRYVSSPFDWMMNYRLETFINFLKQKNLNGFFLNYEYMNRDSGKTKVVKDLSSGTISMHSFPIDMEIEEFYPTFIQIMNRRFERLLQIFEKSHSIVFVSNRKDLNEIKRFIFDFNELYSNKNIVYINIEHSPSLEYEERDEYLSDNIMLKHVYFNDVHANGDTKDNPRAWLGNEYFWTKLCSTLKLSNPQTILTSNEDNELK